MDLEKRIAALEQQVKDLKETLDARYEEIGNIMTVIENLDTQYVKVIPVGVPDGRNYQQPGESLRH